jgi:hypothetical protein
VDLFRRDKVGGLLEVRSELRDDPEIRFMRAGSEAAQLHGTDHLLAELGHGDASSVGGFGATTGAWRHLTALRGDGEAQDGKLKELVTAAKRLRSTQITQTNIF